MLRGILRYLILIPFSLFLSLITAVSVIAFLEMKKFEKFFDTLHAASESYIVFWNTTSISSLWTPSLVVVPTMALTLLGEVMHFRTPLYYILGFGVSLGLLGINSPDIEFQMDHTYLHNQWQVFVTAGFAAGLVYWLLSGRTA